MKIHHTEIAQAVTILQQGGLVAFPTETVYGLGADARNESALSRIFSVKERPASHPLIVHLGSTESLLDWAFEVSDEAYQLAKAFWPGPLTMVFKKRKDVSGLLTAQQETIALRIPRHPLAKALLAAFGGAIAAPSANLFTRISPTTALSVEEELGGRIEMILDGGACEVGLESTIVDMTTKTPTILRPGMIGSFELSQVLGRMIAEIAIPNIRVPGSHHQHYAPKTLTLLVSSRALNDFLHKIKEEKGGKIAILSRHEAPLSCAEGDWILMPQDPKQYAQQLYQILRTVDKQGYASIMIEAVPPTLAWAAIHNRLTKAAQEIF